MKRLRMFLSVRENNVTYKEMYEGKLHMIPNGKMKSLTMCQNQSIGTMGLLMRYVEVIELSYQNQQ